MGAEDVGLFMDDIPGTYFFVGAKDETADAYYGHHHPKFSIDEECAAAGGGAAFDRGGVFVLPES